MTARKSAIGATLAALACASLLGGCVTGDASAGSMTLTWTAPASNTDGSALTDLAGYRIYYGSEAGHYRNRIDVNTPGATAWVVDNLVPGTYYVVATAVNTAGIESAYSNPIVKTVMSD